MPDQSNMNETNLQYCHKNKLTVNSVSEEHMNPLLNITINLYLNICRFYFGLIVSFLTVLSIETEKLHFLIYFQEAMKSLESNSFYIICLY